MLVVILERLFGKAWREEFVVLYEDSSLIWFRDRDRLDPEGGIFLKDAPEMLAAGQVCFHQIYNWYWCDKSDYNNGIQKCWLEFLISFHDVLGFFNSSKSFFQNWVKLLRRDGNFQISNIFKIFLYAIMLSQICFILDSRVSGSRLETSILIPFSYGH